MSTSAVTEPPRQAAGEPLPRLATAVLAVLCAAKLLLHLFTSVRHYGYFRDELYYLDMARHLDWGYVDAAPLIALYAKVALLMGGSLAALRILPALAGTALVALSVLIARELGGHRYAQFLTGLVVLMCPGMLLADSLLTMNAFEPLFWMGGVLVMARLLRTGDSRLWLWFGVLAGLGLENKHSTLIFGFAVTAALLLTRYRREFLKPWIWIAAAIAVALFLPNLIWQIRRHFPTLEDLENVRREGKNVVLGPLAFVREQIIVLNPILCPVWLTGLIWLLRDQWRRVLGLAFVVFFIAMEIEHAKNYYLFPIYPMVFAAGAVAMERWLSGRAAWTRAAVVVVILAATLPTVPLATWMLPPERYIAYTQVLHFQLPKQEVHHAGLLPQPIGDQFGWPELAREVGDIYDSLPPEERARTGILAGNYGEAGAINMLGPKYGLPRALSRHQNHWFWGPPQEDYRNFIFLQFSRDDVEDNCENWQAFEHYSRFGMAEENTPVYLCRGAASTCARSGGVTITGISRDKISGRNQNKKILMTTPRVELLSQRRSEYISKSGRRKRLLRSPAFLLALTAFLVAFAVQSGELGSADTMHRLQATHSFWTSEPAVFPQEYPEFGLHGRHGKLYGWYGIGQSLLMLPADIAGTYLEQADIFDQYRDDPSIRAIVVSYSTSILVCVLLALVCYRLLGQMGFSVGQRIAGVLALLLGTTFLHYTQNMMENNYILLLTLTGLTFQYEWILSGRRRALLMGAAALGLNLLTRLTTGMDIVAVGLFLLLVLWFRGVRGTALLSRFVTYAKIAIPVYAVFGLVDRLYQWYRFGSFFNTYIQVFGQEAKMRNPALPAAYPFETPFRVGFLGALISPEKSIFLFDPLLALTVIGAVLLWRRFSGEIRAYLLAFGLMLLSYICFYARYTVWSGDHAWGDRYVSTAAQLVAFISVPLWLRYRMAVNRWVWRGALALVTISVAIQLASVAFWCPLEIYQREMRARPTYVVALRFQNIADLAAGKNPWGITPDSIEDSWDYAHVTTFNFLPFALKRAGAAPPWVVDVSFALWLAAIAGVMAMLGLLQRKTVSGALESG